MRRCLNNAASFCDGLVVLDDGSTDETREIVLSHPKTLYLSENSGGNGWWGQGAESGSRERLWNTACRFAHEGWVYIFDADHLLVGISPDDFRLLLTAASVDAWACPLYDLWDDEQHMRADGYWQAHLHPRPWLARALPGEWNPKGIHAGHLPLRGWKVGLMPDGAAIAHLGYVNEQHRLAKYKKYLHIA